jgi:thiol-disulfide isomerase/thioredoxin
MLVDTMNVRTKSEGKMGKRWQKRWLAPVLASLLMFASPVSTVHADDEPHAWLGVEFQKTEAGGGARVRHVMRGSPAARAGVRDGDLIVSIDETRVERPDDVINQVGAHAPGGTVRLAVLRPGADAPVRLSVTLAPVPDSDEMLRLDKVGTAAPNFNRLAPVTGTVPPSLGAMRGKVVILDFWATWCTACRLISPRLSAWQAKFGPQGLSVLGITDDPVEDALQGASKFGIRYAVATDESYATQRAFGVRALPTLFVIDKKGIVRDVAVGFDPSREKKLEALLQQLLAEPG